jgi:hypothetical protein
MSDDRWIARGMIAGAAVLVLTLLFVVAACSISVATDATCKARGWRDGYVTWNLHRYCTARINQTDVVVPLEEARLRRPEDG